MCEGFLFCLFNAPRPLVSLIHQYGETAAGYDEGDEVQGDEAQEDDEFQCNEFREGDGVQEADEFQCNEFREGDGVQEAAVGRLRKWLLRALQLPFSPGA